MRTTERTIPATDRRQQAESRLLVIRNALTVADEELARAKASRDWEVFGLGSFEEYCAEMLPELRFIKLRAPERQKRIKALLAEDPDTTEREAAAANGSSAATAHRDFVKVTGRSASNEASPVVADQHASRTDEALARVRAQGARGLTSVELDKETGWPMGTATGSLSRLERRGLVRRLPVKRNNRMAYVEAGR